MLLTTGTTLNEINTELNKLSDEEQKLLLIKLKKGQLLARAKVINQKVKKNNISTTDVVDTVKKNRERNGN